MTFQPGTYYVGDLGCVLPNDDMRSLCANLMAGTLSSGFHLLLGSGRHNKNIGKTIYDPYWYCVTPHQQGTLYDSNNAGWGFDWGVFGVMPWKWVSTESSYESNKIEFTKPFSCSCTDANITIGHLQFTFQPK